MWVFMSDSFLSIVAYRDHPDFLLVRARAAGDIEKVFPTAKVKHTPANDYAYRTILPRFAVEKALALYVEQIDYTNFKNSVSDHDRHGFYFAAYNAILGLGRKALRRPAGAYTEPIPF